MEDEIQVQGAGAGTGAAAAAPAAGGDAPAAAAGAAASAAGGGGGGGGGGAPTGGAAYPVAPDAGGSTVHVPAPAVESIRLARNPGPGRGGSAHKVQVNLFAVKANLPPEVRHYDVHMTKFFPHDPADEAAAAKAAIIAARELGEAASRAAISALEARLGKVMAYDGRKNVYAIDLGVTEPTTYDVEVFGDTIKVTIKDVGSLRTDAMDAYFRQEIDEVPGALLSFLDIVLHTKPAKSRVRVGASFYSNDEKVMLGGGAEAWKGYYHAIKPLGRGMTLAMDVKFTGFWTAMPMLDFVRQAGLATRIDTQMTDQNRLVLANLIKGVRVTQSNRSDRPGGSGRKVQGVSSYAAANLIFSDKDGTKLSVADYFARNYKALEFPDYPCIQVGSTKRPMYLPIEVVQIVGAQRRHRLTDQQTSKLKEMACTRPPIRFQNVERLRRVAAYETDEYLKEFGLTVEPSMLHVSGRALVPPTLIYNHALTVQPFGGRWNMKDKMYYQAGPILHYWGVLILQDSRGRVPPDGKVKRDFMRFLNVLESTSRKTGLAISNVNPMIIVRSKSDVAQAMREIKDTVDGDAREHGQPGCQLILVVKPTNETSDYREIKFQSDSVHGCPSQCMLSRHLERANVMYCANLGLKINSKLGGGNVTLTQPSLDRLKARKTLMIMGLDLSLESKAIARTTDAVAAVVGTLNHQYTEYASAYRFQLAKEEHIMDLTKLAQDVFTSFFERWQKLPEALLVYRDGVADSQMKHVLDVERDALVEAYQNVQPGSTPVITMVVTQKRHRTRFMPVDRSHADQAGNCKPGLCVDGDITQPHQFEFYLQSHTALQGTSRPVRHVVLVNELGLSADELQEITHSLCHVNARCTLSTSMVAPTAYSALVAERGRVMRAGATGEGSDYASSLGGGSGNAAVAPVNNDIKRSIHLKDKLYFM